MAKRPLGLGKSKKSKKPKTDGAASNESKSSKTAAPGPQQSSGSNLMITLGDEMSELVQMWINYINKKEFSDDDEDSEEGLDVNEKLILNGIIHECDRILRTSSSAKAEEGKDTNGDVKENVKVNGEFYAIYGLALAELAYYSGEDAADASEELTDEFDEAKDKEMKKKRASEIHQYFEEALDRIDTGLEKYSQEKQWLTVLKLARSQILLNRIPLEYISTMTLDSRKKEYPDIETLIEQISSSFVTLVEKVGDSSDKEFRVLVEYQVFSIVSAMDDLLDMIENFGVNDDLNEIDSDNEEEIEASTVELKKSHPLFVIRSKIEEFENSLIKKYEWLIQEIKDYNQRVENVNFEEEQNLRQCQKGKSKDESEDEDNKIYKGVELYLKTTEKLGQLYLKRADFIGKQYMELAYGDEDSESDTEVKDKGKETEKERDNETLALIKQLQKLAVSKYKKAIKYLKICEDEENPKTWVNVAEVQISLGNIYDLESKEQNGMYKKAEARLRKANSATNGKYEHILAPLLE